MLENLSNHAQESHVVSYDFMELFSSLAHVVMWWSPREKGMPPYITNVPKHVCSSSHTASSNLANLLVTLSPHVKKDGPASAIRSCFASMLVATIVNQLEPLETWIVRHTLPIPLPTTSRSTYA